MASSKVHITSLWHSSWDESHHWECNFLWPWLPPHSNPKSDITSWWKLWFKQLQRPILVYIVVNQEYTSLLSVTAYHSHPILKPQTLISAQMMFPEGITIELTLLADWLDWQWSVRDLIALCTHVFVHQIISREFRCWFWLWFSSALQ